MHLFIMYTTKQNAQFIISKGYTYILEDDEGDDHNDDDGDGDDDEDHNDVFKCKCIILFIDTMIMLSQVVHQYSNTRLRFMQIKVTSIDYIHIWFDLTQDLYEKC